MTRGTGTAMMKESFDNVYSELHTSKDTYSVLHCSDGALVPFIDERVPAHLQRDPSLRNPLLPNDKPLLPTRSFMGVGAGPGRSIEIFPTGMIPTCAT